MESKKHISLIYQYDDRWIGGTYYILNIIRALNSLKIEEKPFLTIYYNDDSTLSAVKAITYPDIEYVKFSSDLNILKKIFNRINLKVFSRELFLKRLPSKNIANFYFKTFNIDSNNIDKYYFWIADLQDLCLPHFFKANELKKRSETYHRMVKEKQPIVFSSQAALDDFNRFFPDNKNITRVLPFVSITNSNYSSLSFDELKAKFDIQHKYFIVSNQFWAHKNHQIVLKAFAIFCKNNSNVQLLFTGKEYDHRDPNYTKELKLYTENNELKNVRFLGFIDRDEQLKLMSESIAVIQPSLFEGWSTVIEDAKFLNKTVICSNIAVHREQLVGSDLFFDPNDELELVKKMETVNIDGYQNEIDYDYSTEVLKFAANFIELFN